MESQSGTQLKVGIFLAIGIIFTLGSIFFLGADKALFTSYVRVHAYFDQVQGLAIGSVVSLSGVNVGNVEDITFLTERNALDVQMKIDEKYLPKIREGSEVEIRTQGALGDKFIYVIPGDPRNSPIKEGTVLEVAKASDILGILSERGNETARIFDIINELHKMTATINANNRLGKIMSDLEVASKHFSRTTSETEKFAVALKGAETGEKFRKSIDKLDSIVTKIDSGQGTLGALINDPTLHQQLKTMLGGATRKNNVKTLLRTSIEQEEK